MTHSDNDKFRTNATNIFFKNMNYTKYGMWVAHGEGKVEILDKTKINSSNFVPILKYADSFITNESDDDDYEIDFNKKLEYPQNPNGSDNNIAGVISKDGRILGLMPHFERSFLSEQCPYVPLEYDNKKIQLKYTPWFYMTQNLHWFIDNPFIQI